MLGWAVLSQLKQDPRTRHIPVQIVTLDEDRQHGLAGGAFAYVNKPTTMDKLKASIARLSEYARDPRKRLLIVEDNPAELLGITELLGYQDIEVVTADNGHKALAMLREQPADCVVLDLKLPDMSGFELLEHIRQDDALTQVPVVVFTGRELSPEEDAQLHSMARSVIVKGVEFAGSSSRRNRAFPPSRGGGSPAGQATHVGAAAQFRRKSARAQGASGR